MIATDVSLRYSQPRNDEIPYLCYGCPYLVSIAVTSVVRLNLQILTLPLSRFTLCLVIKELAYMVNFNSQINIQHCEC